MSSIHLSSFVRVSAVILCLVLSAPLMSQGDPSLESVRQLVNNGEADAAIRALKSELAKNPSNAEAHNLLCRVHYGEERWDAAVSECERAAVLNGNSSVNQLWLGRAYGERSEERRGG